MNVRHLFGILGLVLLTLGVGAIGAWGALLLAFSATLGLLGHSLGVILAAVTVAAMVSLWLRRRNWPVLAVYAAFVFSAALWWSSMKPSNDRDWQTDVAVLPYATMDGSQVTVHRVRNFRYQSETDYMPSYYDRRYDLAQLTGVDLVAVYWMGPAIAHTFVSFEFANGSHLAISIETRKKKGDDYSTLRGFFRQYELAYVVADERDVIGLRTNYRQNPVEDVYVYRVHGPTENGRALFLEYMRRINSLRDTPEFYNTLTTNCTTDIWANTRVNTDHPPLNWKVLVSGYVPEYLHSIGKLDKLVPFAELEKRSHVNARALSAGVHDDFSRVIRTTVSVPAPAPAITN